MQKFGMSGSPVEADQLENKMWAVVVESLLPVLVLALLLPRNGINLHSGTAVAISCAYGLVGSALKMLLIDKAKPWFFARKLRAEFFIGCGVNYVLVALAILKVFEVVAR